MMGGIAAALTGQNAQGVAIASSTAANAAQNNRFLHDLEIKWLKENAKAFAAQEGISEKEALSRLTQQALKDVDYLWRAQLSDGNDTAAQAFLSQNQKTFVNDLGEQQRLFTAMGSQLFRPEMYADTANPAFYKQFAQSGISRSLGDGLIKELKDSGIDLKNNAANLLKAAKDHPGLVLDAVWQSIKNAPESVKNSVKETGISIGQGSAVAFNGDLKAKLNAIYGTDVSGYQEAMLAIRTFSALAGAGGAAKAGGAAGAAASKAVAKKLDEVATKMAEEALLKSGGVFDSQGRPILDLKQLTTEQKGVLGDLFGANTVKQIVPDGQKLARIPGVGETGIDDLYKVNKPGVDYVVIEYKFVGDYKKAGSSSLGKTNDGRQGAQSWTLGSGRLQKSVGDENAIAVENAMKSGRVETWVVTTRADGATEVQVLDALGKPKPVNTSSILVSGTNLEGAKP